MMVTGPKMRAVGDVKFSTYFESRASGIFGSPDKGSERKTANYSKTFDVGHWKKERNHLPFRWAKQETEWFGGNEGEDRYNQSRLLYL